ncbi:MAG: hypothetical protein AAFY45_30485 [Bacteroidota bacterium]
MQFPLITQAFEVLKDRESFFQKILDDTVPTKLIGSQLTLMGLFTFFYGLIMGSYNSWMQSLVTGVKLFLLILLTVAICFPSFYIVQMILGSKIKLKPLLIILLSGFVVMTTIMLAFAPIVVFFQMGAENYSFIQLLHVGIFIFSGSFGMKFVLDGLTYAFEKTEVYPKIGVVIFRYWIIIFAFVGMQLSWNLRPFVGSKDMPFELFRANTQGNFYTAVLASIGSVMNITGEKDTLEDEHDHQDGVDKAPENPKPAIEMKPEEVPAAQDDSINTNES